MLFYNILINVLFFSVTWGKYDNLISKQNSSTLIKPAVEISIMKDLKIVSEGGTVNTNTPIFKLPNENHTILMSVDEEFALKKQKPVKPRKGAPFSVSEDVDISTSASKPTEEKELFKFQEKKMPNTTIAKTNNTLTFSFNNKLNITSNSNSSSVLDNSKKMAVTEHIKKPTILSYDILANMDSAKKFDDAADVKLNKQLHAPKSSANPMMADQIPPTSNKKAHLDASSRYPKMVTPIIITILVVPVFAVLGYMALKRGKEAWKNRHYKRVDFLLDGMYND